jgi:hypothetical protein
MRGPSWVRFGLRYLVINKVVYTSFGDRAETDVAALEKNEAGREECQW